MSDPINPNASTQARELLSYLYTLMSPDAGLLTGQHNWLEAPTGNITSLALPNSGGKYPAVIGLEVGAISGQNQTTLNNQRGAVMLAARNYWASGGIPTIMWHCTYPTAAYTWTGGVQRNTTQAEFDQVLTPGSNEHNWLIAEMDAIALHFTTLRDQGVPILFRPWHEMNGYWFWWGKKTNFSALWNLTYERFVNVHGLNNIIWVWNPNAMRASDQAIGLYQDYYPGHERVDVLAWDIYGGEFTQRFHDDLYAFGGGKPIALGEVGQLPGMELMRTSQWRYTWAMAWGEPQFSSENTSENKRQFYAHPYAITRDEVQMGSAEPVDNCSPTVPGRLRLVSKTTDTVTLIWDASTDNVAVTGYEVLRNGILAGTATELGYSDTGLLAGTSYQYTVRARDGAGNRSAASLELIVITDADPVPETPVFVRGINFNGPAVTIEGKQWVTEAGAGITTSAVKRGTSNLIFSPAVDSQTNAMLNNVIYASATFSIRQPIPNGRYQIYVWSVENYRSNFRSFLLRLEGVQVTNSPIGSMPLREWRKYGPYDMSVQDGTLNMELARVTGDPIICGMAIYRI